VLAAPTHAQFAVAYLALGAGFVGYLTWAQALNVFGAAKASSLLFLMAPTAMGLDLAITGAVPSITALIGGLIATLGVAIATSGAISFARTPLPSMPSRAQIERDTARRIIPSKDVLPDDF
jgi:drug/metabolite transporter (DMT)-like permease